MSFKLTALALTALLAADLVSAQTVTPSTKPVEPDYTISFNVGAVSDYRFRGISQTSKKPALQGGLDAAFKNGAYVGAWASNVNWVKDFNGATKGSLELDLYGGVKGEIAKDVAYDLGVIAYQYPGNNSGAIGTVNPNGGVTTTVNQFVSNTNTNEIYGAVTYSIYTAKYSRSVGDFLGFIKSSGSHYLDLSAAIDLGNSLTLTPHLGRQVVAGPGNVPFSYTDYSLTLAKDLGNGVVLSATATGTNANTTLYTDANNKTIAKSTVFVGAKYTF